MRLSVGRVPRPDSVVPYDPLWVEGPMGRCVADVALMLDAEAHHDAGDPLSLPPPDRPFSEAVRNPRPPKRVGYTSNLGIGEVGGSRGDSPAGGPEEAGLGPRWTTIIRTSAAASNRSRP